VKTILKCRLILAILLIFLLKFSLAQASDGIPALQNLEDEEYRVVAAVVAQVHLSHSPHWFILADRTTSFECNPPANTGLAIGGCSGMRTVNQEPHEVLQIVISSIKGVTNNLTSDLEAKARTSVPVEKTLPLNIRQVIWGSSSGKSFPRELGNPDFALYHSRVGFNKQKTRALVDVATISWIDSSRSLGEYVYLEKMKKDWQVKGRMKLWSM